MKNDENEVTLTGEVVEHTSRDYNGKTYWTTILRVRGSYHYNDEIKETEDYIALSLFGKQADKRASMPPGSRIKVSGKLTGKRGREGGVFMSVKPDAFAMIEKAEEKPQTQAAEDSGVPF